MQRKNGFITTMLIMFVSSFVFIANSNQDVKVKAFSNQVLQQGAAGEELQSRLAYIGFYTSKVDGVFRWNTY